MAIKVSVRADNPKNLMKDLAKFVKNNTSELINEVYDGVVRDTPVDTGYAKSRWTKDENGIYNDADYIIYLEQGHSDQAPTGFINRNIKQALNRRK